MRTFAVPRLAGDRSAQRIRGAVSDSVTLESRRAPQRDSLVFDAAAAGRSPPAIAPVVGSDFGPGF